MDIKEAIEFIKDQKWKVCFMANQCPEAINYDQVIALLQQGEKLGAILEKVKRIISSHSLIWLETFITELEKEYSLPVKRTITIKMDAEDKEALLTHFSKCFNVDIKEGD